MKTHLLTAVFYLSWLGFSSGKQISITVCKSWTKFKQVFIFRILDSSHAAAAAKLLQSCPTPLSLGFSRQEHWSGLPFLSPVHESEK